MLKKFETELSDDDDEDNCCNKKFCWWAPSPDSIPSSFCNATSIHGLSFLGENRRHLTERLFWLVVFIASFAAAVYLIHAILAKNEKTPVIVSFQSEEQDIGTIPFPAVTLCNVNKFPMTMVQELERKANLSHHPEHEVAKQQLKFVKLICESQTRSFAQDFGYASSRGSTSYRGDTDNTIDEDVQAKLLDFLLEYTIPCEKLLHHCRFGEQQYPCEDLFKPIVTSFGKCCTFNILPLPLLLKSQNMSAPIYDNPALGTRRYWSDDEVDWWKIWKYDDGFSLENNPGQGRPWRQFRAGLPYGLSVLIDPGMTENYFCPALDSDGVRYVLHNPIEMPRVLEFASIANLGREVIVNVHPDMTNADEDIRSLYPKKRKCYYGKEASLNIFEPYTGGNCMDECTSRVLANQCNCTGLFMPRDVGIRICNPYTRDFFCMVEAQFHLQYSVLRECVHCRPLCNDLAYKYDTTNGPMQNASRLWFDAHPFIHRNGTPSWASHKMSLLHVFFGSDTTVPRVRHRLYGTTDLIANIGGILGLCMGVSVLSLVEVFYFMTFRAFWKHCCKRKREIVRKVAKTFNHIFKSNDNRVVCVNPNVIPVYPRTF